MLDYLIIINNEDKVDIAQANTWEFDEYKCLPNENGNHIYFSDMNSAVEWVLDNVKKEMIAEDILGDDHYAIRSKYLKPSSLID